MGSGYDIARAIQRCVANGRSEADCWNSTPKQLSAWIELIDRAEAARDARYLDLLRAAKSDAKSFRAVSKKLREIGS